MLTIITMVYIRLSELIHHITGSLVNFTFERLLLNHEKTLGFLASREEFNPGPETRLDRSELLCNKVLLKRKREKASDIGIRRGQKEYPPASLQLDVV